MTRILLIFVLLAPATHAAARIDNARLLAAIAEVETGGRPRPGRAGESGACQLGPAARHDHATPLAHLLWLRRELRRAGRDDVRDIALAWNAGLARTLAHREVAASRDYAQRVANLYTAPGRP